MFYVYIVIVCLNRVGIKYGILFYPIFEGRVGQYSGVAGGGGGGDGGDRPPKIFFFIFF